MSDAMVIGLTFFVPILVLAIAVLLSGYTDKTRPDDWVARRHQQIARNGFKSRMGVK